MKIGASMRLFPRENYLKKIRGFYHGEGMIKVITGVRRCGKSCLMQCIAEELRAESIDDEHIVFFDLDRYGYRSVKAPEQLEDLIRPLLAISGTKYLFIDEVQNSMVSKTCSTGCAPKAASPSSSPGQTHIFFLANWPRS